MGRGYLYAFTVLCLIAAFVNSAALLIFSANLLVYFVPAGISIAWLSAAVIAICLAILFMGHYKALDTISKAIMVTLSIATVLAMIIAFGETGGSMLTVLDGYGRVLAETQSLILTGQPASNERWLGFWILIIAAVALAIVVVWTSSLLAMLNFAMTVGFVAAPFVALLNYVLIKRTALPDDLQSGKGLNLLAICGLLYLAGFVALFIWWKWLM